MTTKQVNDLGCLLGLTSSPTSASRLTKAGLMSKGMPTNSGWVLIRRLCNGLTTAERDIESVRCRGSNNPSWQPQCGRPTDPIRDVLKALVGSWPPKYVKGYRTPHDPEEHEALINWIGSNMTGNLYWSTLIGIVEAADQIVSEAVENGNIPPEGTE